MKEWSRTTHHVDAYLDRQGLGYIEPKSVLKYTNGLCCALGRAQAFGAISDISDVSQQPDRTFFLPKTTSHEGRSDKGKI